MITNWKMTLILMVVAMGSMLTAQEKLRRTLGKWPNGLHNTTLKSHVIKFDTPGYAVPLKGNAAVQAIYGIVGAPNKHHFSHVYSSNKGLVLGGSRPGQAATVIWKFSAPKGQAFKFGQVTIDGQAVENADLKGSFAVVTPAFKFTGGGGFWHAFRNIKFNDYKNAVQLEREGHGLKATLPIPAHCREFYVIVARKPGVAGLSFTLTDMTVKAGLNQASALAIRFRGKEPVWAANEKIVFTIKTSDKSQSHCWWRVSNQFGSATKSGVAVFNNSLAKLELSGISAGFYKLDVFNDKAMPKAVDSEQFAILSSQNPDYVKQSIFGSFGHPCFGGVHGSMGTPDDVDLRLMKLMGVRWVVESALWAWRQRGPEAPIDLDFLPLLKRIHSHGFELIVNTGTTPRWANGGRQGAAPPVAAKMEYWRRFNTAVAKACKGTVTWFQAWNEPNNPHALWQPKPWNFDKRSLVAKQIQRAQYEGLKKGNPDAKLIGGNFAGVPANWFAKWLSEPESTLTFQDAMSGHPYCKVTRENNWQHRFPAEPNLIPRLLESRQAMDKHGAKEQPLFWTEYGWFTPTTSPQKQASWTARQNIIIQAYKEKTKTEALCIFSPGDIKNGHNILRKNPDLKPGEHRLLPVIGSFATSAALLAGSTPLPAVSDYPEAIRCYAFKRGNELLYAAWKTERGNDKAAVILPVKEVRTAIKIDLLGGEQVVVLKPGEAVPVNSNHQPEYYKLSTTPQLHVVDKHVSCAVDSQTVASQTVVVANIGPGSLPVDCSANVPWLTVNKTQAEVTAAAPLNLVLTIDPATLAAGENAGVLTVKSKNGLVTINVTAAKLPAP